MKHLILLFSAVLVIFGCSSNNNGTVTVVPLAPTNLTGAVISTTQINLSWTDNATNEEGYKIERKTGAGNYAVVGSTSSNMTTFSDLGLTPSTSYTYRVYAYNSAGNSLQYSNEVTFSTLDSIPSWLSNGLVGYWPFNGNANDESGSGNNGTVNGATLATDRFGNVNKAFHFDGITSRIVTSNIPNLSGSFSISAWVNTEALSAWGTIIDCRTSVNAGLGIEHNSQISLTTSIGNSYSYLFANFPFTTNNWIHIVGVINNTQKLIYVNGILDNSQSTSQLLQTSEPFVIGDRGVIPSGPGNYYKGLLDDIRIYNRALSATEVAYLAAH